MLRKINFIPTALGWLIIAAVMILISALLYALPLWIVWNLCIPRLFNGPQLTLIDAFLLNLLAGILFKSKIENRN